jgi:hypothetical protein
LRADLWPGDSLFVLTHLLSLPEQLWRELRVSTRSDVT